MGRPAVPVQDRFWPKVNKRGPDDCWEWTGSGSKSGGYGGIKSGGVMVGAHRVSWELEYGPVPEGICVCHSCDNKICVNPRHLFLGTHQDNMADMDSKGRRVNAPAQGERNGNSVLTERDVLAIRELGKQRPRLTYREIAREYGVHRQYIGLIINRTTWQHI